MLVQPLLEKLTALKLSGFRDAFKEQLENPHYAELSFEERLGLLVDVECTRREDNSLRRRISAARFATTAVMEDLDFSQSRGLDRAFVLELALSEWIRRHLNVLVTGATGAGKTYLACALGHAACRQGFSVQYARTSRLLHQIMLSHADGSFPKLLRSMARLKLLVLDDWLRDPLSMAQARDLLEILDDRYNRSSTLLVTQIPVENWHDRFPDPTLGDAIMDRLVHNAYRIELKGESMRKTHSRLPSQID